MRTHGAQGHSNVWALFTEFDLTMSNGNLNSGDDKVGGSRKGVKKQ